MAEQSKLPSAIEAPNEPMSVILSVASERLPSAVSAALAVAESARISVRGNAEEIVKAVKALDVSDAGPVSALIRVRSK